MNNILRSSEDPLGGNIDLYFVPDTDVNSIENIYTNAVFIDFATGKKFYKMECVHATSEVKSSGVKTALGKLFDIVITATIAGNLSDNAQVLTEMLDYSYIVVLKDNNCNNKVFGNTEQPLEFKIVHSGKSETSQRKETQVTFLGQCFIGEKTLSNTLQYY